MKEQLISSETAKLAKEKGFDEKCLFFYTGDSKELKQINLKGISNSDTISFCSAPSQSLLQKWLREKYSIYAESRYNETFNYFEDYVFYNNNYPKPTCIQKDVHSTYEIGLEFALIEALNFIDSDLVIDNEG